jgi:hypothetical protein
MQYPDLSFEPFFTWANRPRVMYKAGVRDELGFEMEKLGGTKVLLYTDKGLVQAGVAEMVIEAIKASSLELVPTVRRRLHGGRGGGQCHGYGQGHQHPDWWGSR